ncbi:MAG TPA: hypothetical protein VF262_00160 [Burkholderiales bacterium]|jgi:hypothetical protein
MERNSLGRIGLALALALPALPAAAAAYDLNGVALGGSEKDVKKVFPAAYCKPLEWKSDASDRRCDDAKVSFGGVESKVTIYLKKGIVQAFDVRFDTKDVAKVSAYLKKRYGAPESEAKEVLDAKPGKGVYKALWESGKDRASLVSQLEKKRAQLTVWRGNWEEEIYRVR